MSNVYYDPEKNGLEVVAEHNFHDEPYEFDFRVIWKHLATGRYYTARDSGCSCPCPFETYSVDELEEFSVSALVEEARKEARNTYYSGHPVVPWINEIRKIGRRKGAKR